MNADDEAEDYFLRCRETLAKRILVRLVETGIFTSYDEAELLYPSEEQLKEAENG